MGFRCYLAGTAGDLAGLPGEKLPFALFEPPDREEADGAFGRVAFDDGLHVEPTGHEGDAGGGEGHGALVEIVFKILGGTIEQGVDQRGLGVDLPVRVGVTQFGREHGFELLASRREHGRDAGVVRRVNAGQFRMFSGSAGEGEE